MYQIMRKPLEERSLSKADILLPTLPASQDQLLALEGFALEEQDQLSEYMADGALLLVALRILRSLWMLLGWPSKLGFVGAPTTA